MQVSRIETSDAPWPVMVLAYNEERKIVECLDSIYAADPTRQFEIFVMANGCTDRTEDIVREYGRKHKGVHLVSIKMPDYCNAWNVFIHETAAQHLPDSQIYFFLDGDCRVHPGSMSEMARALAAHETAHAAGSVQCGPAPQGEPAARDPAGPARHRASGHDRLGRARLGPGPAGMDGRLGGTHDRDRTRGNAQP